jgi:hypothetical protein
MYLCDNDLQKKCCVRNFRLGGLEEQDKPHHVSDATINSEHLLGRLDRWLQGHGDVPPADRLPERVGRIGPLGQLIANGRHDSPHKPIVGPADRLEDVRSRKLMDAL